MEAPTCITQSNCDHDYSLEQITKHQKKVENAVNNIEKIMKSNEKLDEETREVETRYNKVKTCPKREVSVKEF